MPKRLPIVASAYPPSRPAMAARLALVLLVLLGLLTGRAALAQGIQPTLPPGFSASLVVNGFVNPTAFTFAPDGRIFAAEQAGRLRIIKNGVLLPTPFVSLTVDSRGERGLVGVTLDPNFSTNRYVYLYYTLASGANNRIVRYTASAANGDVADLSTGQVILNLDPLDPTATNHNGGAMHFGPDGKLYVAVGENAGGEIPSQGLDTYMGKLLRLNPDGSVPAGNPYVGSGLSAQRQRIWSYGLRNPYTFGIQPGTGKIFINDVGGGSWEEINDASVGGRNFGWQHSEGYNNLRPGDTGPLYAYSHNNTLPVNQNGCAITGGTFFNPASTNYPAQYRGKYFFQDLCNSWINYLDPASSSPAPFQGFATNLPSQSLGLETGPDGNLYYLARYPAVALYKIVYTAASSAPVVTTHPQSVAVAPGVAVTFSVAATGTAPLSYQWQKDGVDLPTNATGSSYSIPSPTVANAGQYRVVITNSVGSVTSNAATLTITAPNTAPTATILTPAAGTTYVAGTTLTFSGDATDPEQGALPASAFSWQLDFYHDTHVHDGTPFNQGAKTGSFTIPIEEKAANVRYRLTLTVTDAGGLKGTSYVEIFPRNTTFTLATSPAGLQLTLDNAPRATPLATVGVEGIPFTIGAPSPQTVNGVTYEFVSWSDGGAQNHVITTPTDDVTYTATFKVVVPPTGGQAVTSLTLFNADTDLPLDGYDPLPSGATLNLATLPTRNLNIRANTNPATVGSVRFAYDGNANYKVESQPPYAIAGDNGTSNGRPNYNAWTPTVGSHTLTVTPYTGGGGGGTAGTPITVTFTVTNDAGTAGLRTPENPTGTAAGLDYAYYEGTGWGSLPPFASLTPVKTGTTAAFELTSRQRDDNFAFRYTGFVTVPADGVYTFYTNSDDGSRLAIGSAVVVDNDGLHGNQEKSGQIGLKAGTHALTVTFFEAGGDQVLGVSYAGPGLSKRALLATALARLVPATGARTTALASTTPAGATRPALVVQLYPNPARDEVTLVLEALVAQPAQVNVYDALGQRVARFERPVQAGRNELRLPLPQLANGVYSVAVQQGDGRSVQRLVVNK
ncbi:PQQ-dependent sugar dehydrogenase [uncultured Hymenobacter sp.]|uniref:PQQ-dependent sugar dehydrogenase n=1 Tax=uncultured Hymenobacter sp. TaxID=170016 RepID=UPI0035C9E796